MVFKRAEPIASAVSTQISGARVYFVYNNLQRDGCALTVRVRWIICFIIIFDKRFVSVCGDYFVSTPDDFLHNRWPYKLQEPPDTLRYRESTDLLSFMCVLSVTYGSAQKSCKELKSWQPRSHNKIQYCILALCNESRQQPDLNDKWQANNTLWQCWSGHGRTRQPETSLGSPRQEILWAKTTLRPTW